MWTEQTGCDQPGSTPTRRDVIRKDVRWSNRMWAHQIGCDRSERMLARHTRCHQRAECDWCLWRSAAWPHYDIMHTHFKRENKRVRHEGTGGAVAGCMPTPRGGEGLKGGWIHTVWVPVDGWLNDLADATAGVTGAEQKPGGMCSGSVIKALIEMSCSDQTTFMTLSLMVYEYIPHPFHYCLFTWQNGVMDHS